MGEVSESQFYAYNTLEFVTERYLRESNEYMFLKSY